MGYVQKKNDYKKKPNTFFFSQAIVFSFYFTVIVVDIFLFQIHCKKFEPNLYSIKTQIKFYWVKIIIKIEFECVLFILCWFCGFFSLSLLLMSSLSLVCHMIPCSKYLAMLIFIRRLCDGNESKENVRFRYTKQLDESYRIDEYFLMKSSDHLLKMSRSNRFPHITARKNSTSARSTWITQFQMLPTKAETCYRYFIKCFLTVTHAINSPINSPNNSPNNSLIS